MVKQGDRKHQALGSAKDGARFESMLAKSSAHEKIKPRAPGA